MIVIDVSQESPSLAYARIYRGKIERKYDMVDMYDANDRNIYKVISRSSRSNKRCKKC